MVRQYRTSPSINQDTDDPTVVYFVLLGLTHINDYNRVVEWFEVLTYYLFII